MQMIETDFIRRAREFLDIPRDDPDVSDEEAAQQFWELLDECKEAARGRHLAVCVESGIKYINARAALQGIVAACWHGDAKTNEKLVKLAFNIYNDEEPGKGIED